MSGRVIVNEFPNKVYSISGHIADSNNNPLSSVTVSAGSGGSATTDVNGNYTISGLIASTYTLTPTKGTFYTFSPAIRIVSVPPDAIGQDFVGTPIPQGISFRPNPDGYNFGNDSNWYEWWLPWLGPKYDFSINDLADLFGRAYVCASYENGNCTANKQAQDWYNSVVTQTLKGGHCAGMSATSLRFFEGWDIPAAFQWGATTTYDLSFANARRHVSFFQMLVATSAVYSSLNNASIAQTPTQALNLLRDSFAQGTADPFMLVIAKPDGSESHMLVPYLVGDRGNGIWWIWVYDPNFPNGGSDHFVIVDSNQNTWSYNLGGGEGVWSGGVYPNYKYHTLFVVPLSAFNPYQYGKCSWCQADIISQPLAQVTLYGGGHLFFTDNQGRQLGYVGTQYVSEIPGAGSQPVIGAGESHEPIYYLPVTATYTITLDGSTLTQTQSTSMRQFGPGYAAGVETSLAPTMQDQATITPDGSQIGYRTNDSHSVGLVIIGDITQTASYKFNLRSTLAAGKVITLTNSRQFGKLVVSNRDGGISGSYQLTFNRMTATGEQVFSHANVPVTPGDTHYLDYGIWNGQGDLTLQIDHGSDGTIDDLLVLNNQAWQVYLPLVTRSP